MRCDSIETKYHFRDPDKSVESRALTSSCTLRRDIRTPCRMSRHNPLVTNSVRCGQHVSPTVLYLLSNRSAMNYSKYVRTAVLTYLVLLNTRIRSLVRASPSHYELAIDTEEATNIAVSIINFVLMIRLLYVFNITEKILEFCANVNTFHHTALVTSESGVRPTIHRRYYT